MFPKRCSSSRLDQIKLRVNQLIEYVNCTKWHSCVHVLLPSRVEAVLCNQTELSEHRRWWCQTHFLFGFFFINLGRGKDDLEGGKLLVCFCFPTVQDAEKGDHVWKVTDESSLLLSTRREDYCTVIHGLLLTEGTDLYCKNMFFGNMSSIIRMDVCSTTDRCFIILYFSCSITIADGRCQCLKVPTVCLAYLCLGHRMRLSSFVNSLYCQCTCPAWGNLYLALFEIDGNWVS